MAEKKVITVLGMSCDHCKKAVEKAAKSIAGVETATVNLAEKALAVEYDGKQATLEQIKAAVEDAGYDIG